MWEIISVNLSRLQLVALFTRKYIKEVTWFWYHAWRSNAVPFERTPEYVMNIRMKRSNWKHFPSKYTNTYYSTVSAKWFSIYMHIGRILACTCTLYNCTYSDKCVANKINVAYVIAYSWRYGWGVKTRRQKKKRNKIWKNLKSLVYLCMQSSRFVRYNTTSELWRSSSKHVCITNDRKVRVKFLNEKPDLF